MARRVILPSPGHPYNRDKREQLDIVPRALITVEYGPVQTPQPPYARICTGGSWMKARLGPDMLVGGTHRGTPTSNQSLQPLMSQLDNSHKKWKAGHLLNADFGGSGTDNNNLTALTSAANAAHKTFEEHIRRMLNMCHNLDDDQVGDAARLKGRLPHWYGVYYKVVVSGARYADPPDMHSYVYSHISLDYQFVTLPKFPVGGRPPQHRPPPPPDQSAPVAMNDPNAGRLQSVARPSFRPSVNIENWYDGGLRFTVDIRNEDQ